jgi:isopenicillin N synthase-like dioxygenase
MLDQINILHLPVIHYPELLSKPRKGKEQLSRLRDALELYGFCYLQDCIDSRLLGQSFEQARRFFALPLEEKRKLQMDDRYRGYDPGDQTLRLKNLSPDKAQKLQKDMKEGYRLWDPHQQKLDARVPWSRLFGHPNRLPPRRLMPEFGPILFECRKAVADAMSVVMEAIEECLELPQGLVTEYNDPGFMPLRLLRYPHEAGGSNAHSDWGRGTILFTDTWGLQMLMPGDADDAVWHDIPPREGCAIFNIADLLTTLTDGRLIATRHRVVMSPHDHDERDKYSLVAFDYGHRGKKVGGKYCAEIVLDKFDQSYGFGRYAS